MGKQTPSSSRLKFPASRRLSGRRAFAAVYDLRLRKTLGPLTVYARANQLPHSRLGLSVSSRVGKAVTRNRIKRLLREAFRLNQHQLPTGYDWVIVVRPHEPLKLDAYADLLGKTTTNLQQRSVRP
ncbi:MAG: ribonuclease P protein component [Phycisphaeraceae bacterium]|nr:ribonuclease P protein component [Phycisphaeraceae bacterium]